jgi:signal transduction histidine kinase
MGPLQPKRIVSETWFNRLVVGAVAAGFLLLVVAGWIATWSVAQNQAHARWVEHTYQVQNAIARFRVLTELGETARRGYLLSSKPSFITIYARAQTNLDEALDKVQRLTVDNPAQQRNVEATRVLLAQHRALIAPSLALARAGRGAEAAAGFGDEGSVESMRKLRTASEVMTTLELRLLAARDDEQKSSMRAFYWTLALAGALLVLVAALTIWVILRYTQALTQSRNALGRLNEDLEGAVRERTRDLQRANDEIQRFAYIVSHDLRSPLVNVMGFTAELESAAGQLSRLVDKVEEVVPDKLEQVWADAARVDLPEAIGFIRSSTQKMDRLINAILRLSREGRRTIAPEPIDMTALAQGIADSLKHRVDELGAEIRIEGTLPSIVSDKLGIEQILSNLVENAVKYLKPGRPGLIRVGGRVHGDRATFVVVDNGRGIDPRDHERVFDLFRRSGMQDQPGEGIGLAHVRALAYRLGGTVSVESALDEGATFRIDLPVKYSGEQRITT